MEFFLEHFGFKKDPFENSYDLELYYISSSHRKVLSKLYRVAVEEGITCIIGDFGTGKTFSLKKFISELKETKAIYINNHFESFDSLLDYIVDELEITPKDNSTDEMLSLIKEYTNSKRIIIVIDDAQNLSLNVLNNLRLLILASDNIKLVLSGNNRFETILNLSALQLLKQKIKSIAKLKNLNKKDTKKYVNAKIYTAGGLKLKITSGAYKLVYKITKGNPYLINLLMEEALYIAFKKKKKKISKSYIKKAAKNLKLKYKKRSIFTYLIWLTIAILTGMIIYSTEIIDYRGLIPFQINKININKEELSSQKKDILNKIEKKQPQEEPQKENEKTNYKLEKLKHIEPIKPTEETLNEEVEEEPMFVESKQKRKKDEIIGKKAKVSVAFINLRKNPDTNSTILAVIPENYEVIILEKEKNDWVKVSYYSKRQQKEIIGWIKRKYLKIEEAE